MADGRRRHRQDHAGDAGVQGRARAPADRRRSTRAPKLLSELRRTFDDDARDRTSTSIDALAAVDLLHLDDVGAERSNEWVLEQLYAIVNARYEEEKAIVITSNLGPTELEEQISERTVSRLHEMCGDPLPLRDEVDATHARFVERSRPGRPLRYGGAP